jgi:hypothetical protein
MNFLKYLGCDDENMTGSLQSKREMGGIPISN